MASHNALENDIRELRDRLSKTLGVFRRSLQDSGPFPKAIPDTDAELLSAAIPPGEEIRMIERSLASQPREKPIAPRKVYSDITSPAQVLREIDASLDDSSFHWAGRSRRASMSDHDN